MATVATEKDKKGQKAEEQRAKYEKTISTFDISQSSALLFKSLQYQCLDFRSPQKHSVFGSQVLV